MKGERTMKHKGKSRRRGKVKMWLVIGMGHGKRWMDSPELVTDEKVADNWKRNIKSWYPERRVVVIPILVPRP